MISVGSNAMNFVDPLSNGISFFVEAQVPPGALSLDVMLYFASYHPEKYSRVVLENSGRGDEYDCPFARAAIELTKLLCEILKVTIC